VGNSRIIYPRYYSLYHFTLRYYHDLGNHYANSVDGITSEAVLLLLVVVVVVVVVMAPVSSSSASRLLP